jgi:hypothetical protein
MFHLLSRDQLNSQPAMSGWIFFRRVVAVSGARGSMKANPRANRVPFLMTD